jgi:hypothetical protein
VRRFQASQIMKSSVQIQSFCFLVTCTYNLFNPLNAELNPICHLLVLLGNLTFMDPCIVSVFQYISNKMQRYTVYLYLETALHVSGGTSTNHQERIQLYLQHLVFVRPLLLPAAIATRSSNQQDANIQVNLLFLVSSTCFGRCFRPSSEALDCIYSIRYCSPKLLPAGVLDELELSSNSIKAPAGSNLGEQY